MWTSAREPPVPASTARLPRLLRAVAMPPVEIRAARRPSATPHARYRRASRCRIRARTRAAVAEAAADCMKTVATTRWSAGEAAAVEAHPAVAAISDDPAAAAARRSACWSQGRLGSPFRAERFSQTRAVAAETAARAEQV